MPDLDYKDLAAIYGLTSGDVRNALRMAFMLPSNAPLLWSKGIIGSAPTRLGEFLFETGIVVEKILRRNVALGAEAFVSDDVARYWTSVEYGLPCQTPNENPQRRIRVAFEDSAEEVNQPSKLIPTQALIGIIDRFMWISHIKERREYIDRIIKLWRNFRAETLRDDNAPDPMLQTTYFMDKLAKIGVSAYIEKRMLGAHAAKEVEQTLRLHQTVSDYFGAPDRTEDIRDMIYKYEGLMFPVILPYRMLCYEVRKSRRQSFNFGTYEAEGATRQSFLLSLDDSPPYTNKVLWSQTVEHMAPLATSDNFIENFALLPRKANCDNSYLVNWQTTFLPHDEVLRQPEGDIWKFAGETVNVITLRPRMMTYGNGKTFPGFLDMPCQAPALR